MSRTRTAAVTFILVTVALDVLVLGIVIPVLPKLIEEFMTGDTVRAAGGRLLRRGRFAPGMPYAYVANLDGYEIELWYEWVTPGARRAPAPRAGVPCAQRGCRASRRAGTRCNAGTRRSSAAWPAPVWRPLPPS